MSVLIPQREAVVQRFLTLAAVVVLAAGGLAQRSDVPPASDSVPVTADSVPIDLPVPETISEMLAQLKTRQQQVAELIEAGNLTDVFVPAFQAKDLAVALEPRQDRLTPEKRAAAQSALVELVRTAWLLDAFGDLGNRRQVAEAYTLFSSSVERTVAAFAGAQ